MRFVPWKALEPLVVARRLVCATPLLLAAGVGAQDLGDVTRRIPAERHRASSGLFDPESNRDARPIAPGETLTVAELDGPGEIRHIWMTVGSMDRRFTRSVVLRIYWDGSDTPSVESPIGDLFAAGNGMRADVSSLPIEVTSYGRAFNSYWRMPFRRSARITVTNDADVPVSSLYYYVDWLGFESLPPDSLYFHARYRQEFPPEPFTEYTVADIRGAGHYVGTVLSIQSSMGHWLGESDDRFYIDGERLPSLVGTGLEDYFTDAWNDRLFTNLRAGVSIYEPKGLDQRVTFYRWHLADPITFDSSLRMEIERRSYAGLVDPETGEDRIWDFKYRPDFFSSVAFWYATEPAPRFWEMPPLVERVNPEVFVETTLMVDDLPRSERARVSQRVTRSSNAASGPVRRLMTLVDAEGPGDWVEVPFTLERSGHYSISVYQIRWDDMGLWRVSLRGPGGDDLLDPALDFYDHDRSDRARWPESYLYGSWKEAKLGVRALEPGEYRLRFECVGANPVSRVPGTRDTYIGTRVLQPERAGRPGFGMGLDGISLRLLPWGDGWAWMQDYLEREGALFAERRAQARRDVARLAASLERRLSESGTCPSSLEDAGADAPIDPWGQEYRFRCPGEKNPGGVDVWSVHGNARRPEGWIGNWPGAPE